MSNPMIAFQNVQKRFGEETLLHSFDFKVDENEIVSVIGPSGSGKSTILRILMTLEGIDGGDVSIGGTNLWKVPHQEGWKSATEKHLRSMRQQVGMVFQHFNLFPNQNVLGNLTLAPLKVAGESKQEVKERALELLQKVNLSDKTEAMPRELSGGQKQRVAIARALMMRPKVLLLDEITSALDPELIGEVLDVIRSLAQRHEMTMLIVTHEMGFARDISDRVCFLDGGMIVEEGTPGQILENPSHPRTREFLDSFLKNRV